MKLGILETGRPPKGLEGYGDYPTMFEALLGPDTYAYARFDVEHGEFPDGVGDADAWLITGSSSGAYDGDRWIEDLSAFLVECRVVEAPLVGVCFGHQIMAQAFGGKVEKSDKGWGIGLHTYAVAQSRPWMDSALPIAIPASHQDQVVVLPAGAELLGGNTFCPNGMLAYGERGFSIQLHPEFDPSFAKALLEVRSGIRVPKPEADAAIHALDARNDRHRVGGWIRRFLDSATGASIEGPVRP